MASSSVPSNHVPVKASMLSSTPLPKVRAIAASLTLPNLGLLWQRKDLGQSAGSTAGHSWT